jgi:hypothetical protein
MLNQNHLRASNPQTQTVQLKALAEHEQPEVRSRVAENPRSPLTLLSALTWDNAPEVRASVASVKNVPPSIKRLRIEQPNS